MKAVTKKYPLNPVKKITDLKDMTDKCVSMYADLPAFRTMLSKTEYETKSFNEFGQELCVLANAFIEKGWDKKRIALIGENSYLWLLSYFAIVNIGATVVPLDKELGEEDIAELIKRSGASVFIHSKNYDDEGVYAKKKAKSLKTVSLGEKKNADFAISDLLNKGKDIVSSGVDKYSELEIDPEKPCSILFTSGTTGKSKGVMLSHKNFAANVVSACELVKYTTEDVFVSILPIHHAYEDMGGLFCVMYQGSCIAFCEGVKKLMDALALFKPTKMVLVPLYIETFYNRIWEKARKSGKDSKLRTGIRICNLLAAFGIDIRDKLLADVRKAFGGRLKLIISGGAYLNPAYVKHYKAFGITIVQGYGITECSPIISVNRNECLKEKSVGWLCSCNDVKIDEDGQILVKGDNVMIGYLDDEEATKEAFDGEWFKTGDLGYMDKDGFLYVTGRCKNLIVLKNGKNIMPDEIESLLKQSSLIAETMVKESNGDENGAESIMAIIYPDPTTTQGMQTRDICAAIQKDIDEINQKLVYYKRVNSFVLRESEFPKTTTKKIQRFKVGKE